MLFGNHERHEMDEKKKQRIVLASNALDSESVDSIVE